MQFMTVDNMSSEHLMWECEEGESKSENGYERPDLERPKKKVLSVSSLRWQSPVLTRVIYSLDRKSTSKRSAKGNNKLVERRRTGIISSRLATDDADPFAPAGIIGAFCSPFVHVTLFLRVWLHGDFQPSFWSKSSWNEISD